MDDLGAAQAVSGRRRVAAQRSKEWPPLAVMTSRTSMPHRHGAFFKCGIPAHGGLQVPRRLHALSPHAGRGSAASSRSSRATSSRRGARGGSRHSRGDRMPADAPEVKVAATRGYGAEVILYDRAAGQDRETFAARIAAERGATVIPPFDHAHVIAGQGTAAKELLEETGPLDWLFVCCGGGGLLSGCAVAAAHLSPASRSSRGAGGGRRDAARSFRRRTLQRVENPQTIADGARTQSMGRLTFPLVLAKRPRLPHRHRRGNWSTPCASVGAHEAGGAHRGARDRRRAVGPARRPRRPGRHHLSGGNVDLRAAARLFA